MSRKTCLYEVSDEKSRDHGKLFHISEKSAYEAERWALRAFFAMANSGIEVPEDMEGMGIAGLASMGMNALGKIRFEDAEPLLEEMMQCVRIIPDPNKTNVMRPLIEDDIEEIKTRLILRREVFKLHVDFLEPAAPSTSGRAAAKA